MTVLRNSFSGGSNGVTISTGNSGGISGNAFDVVNTGSLATLTYDSTHSIHGPLAANFTTGSPTANCVLEWTTSLGGSSAQLWYRAYVYITAYTGNLRLIRGLQGGTLCGAVSCNAAAKISLLDSTGAGQATSNTTLPTNAWYRLEGYFIGNASTGQVQCKIFTIPDSPTPVETLTTAATLNTVGTMNRMDFGNPSSLASYTFWMDSVGASTTGFIGPAKTGSGSSIVPALIAMGGPA